MIFAEGERYGFERDGPTTRLSPAAAEVGDARLTAKETASSSTTATVPTASAIERALQALTETSLLVNQQIRHTSEGRKQTCTGND